MSKEQVHIRCSNCGTFNENADLCLTCGQPLNMIKQREDRRRDLERERVAKALAEEPSAIERFLLRMTKHRWLFVRIIFKVIYGVWFTVMAVTMFIAWLIGMILA